MKLKITTHEKSVSVFEVSLTGRLDSETHQQLEAAFDLLFESSPRAIQLDLAGLEYISSIGLRVILLAMKRLKPTGGKLVIVRAQPQVQKVFEIVKLLPAEHIFVSTEEADRYFDAIQRKEREKLEGGGRVCSDFH